MSVSGVSTGEAGGGKVRSSGGTFEAARWLARNDIGRSWLSYPGSGLVMLLFGFFAVSVVSDTYGASGPGVGSGNMFDYLFADVFFAVMCCVVVANWVSREYMRLWTKDVFSEKTAFLKSIPVSTQTVVYARVMTMLAAVPLNILGLFLPTFLFTGYREMGFSYLWFVGIWLGWSLLYGGLTLLCELGMSGRTYVWISFPLVFGMMAAVIALDVFTGSGLIVGAANIAISGLGAVAAFLSVAVGSAGLLVFAKLTIRRIDGREVGN